MTCAAVVNKITKDIGLLREQDVRVKRSSQQAGTQRAQNRKIDRQCERVRGSARARMACNASAGLQSSRGMLHEDARRAASSLHVSEEAAAAAAC